MDALPITKAQVAKLMATGKVLDIECEGMDEGRYFVHLTKAYCWVKYGDDISRTKSFGGYREAQQALKKVERV